MKEFFFETLPHLRSIFQMPIFPDLSCTMQIQNLQSSVLKSQQEIILFLHGQYSGQTGLLFQFCIYYDQQGLRTTDNKYQGYHLSSYYEWLHGNEL